MPKRDNAEPKRKNDLMDNELPTWKKSTTESDAPKRANLRKDNDAPR
jgi:hypothetical protein